MHIGFSAPPLNTIASKSMPEDSYVKSKLVHVLDYKVGHDQVMCLYQFCTCT